MLSQFTDPKTLLEERILRIRDHPSEGENEIDQIVWEIENLIRHAETIYQEATAGYVNGYKLRNYIRTVYLILAGQNDALRDELIMNDNESRFLILTDLYENLVQVDNEIKQVQLPNQCSS